MLVTFTEESDGPIDGEAGAAALIGTLRGTPGCQRPLRPAAWLPRPTPLRRRHGQRGRAFVLRAHRARQSGATVGLWRRHDARKLHEFSRYRRSLLTRLCASVPPPRFHRTRYAGVLASASKLRSRILPEPPASYGARLPNLRADDPSEPRRSRCRYRPWAELMMRTFSLDVLCCPRCSGSLRLVALMTEPKEITRYLRALGESTSAPPRRPARGPPFWASRVLRRRAGEDNAA